jgi:hypothetical protein
MYGVMFIAALSGPQPLPGVKWGDGVMRDVQHAHTGPRQTGCLRAWGKL